MATSKQSHSITTDEARNVAVDMGGFLSGAETLTGTPQTQALNALTITDVQINSSVLTVNGRQAEIGQAVLFKASSSNVGRYLIDVVCSTDAGQTVEGTITLSIVATANA